ncbi:MAG: RcnB family protein [Azoarcus sp.]|jgi:hypothetical protein|nr:RcnB family protein [Azoarcus sp.]
MKVYVKSLAALLAVGLFASTSVLAQPYRDNRRPPPGHVPPPPPPAQRVDHYTPPPPPAAHRPNRPWREGQKFHRSPKYKYYDVSTRDRKRYGLQPPPRGYRYMRAGDDILLIAIGTSIITNIIYDAVRH